MATKTTKPKTTKPKAKKAVSKPKQAEPVVTKQGKPVFPVGTWVAILFFAALIGLAVMLNRQKTETANEPTPTPGTAPVFGAAVGEPSSIEVAFGKDPVVKIERDETNAWAMTMPDKVEANQGLAEAAASQAASLQFVDELEGDLSIYGLDQPAFVITLSFSDKSKHILEVGDSTPTNSGYYVHLDKKRILIVELSGIDALTNLALFPPYLNTPTPTPLPATATPVPPTEVEATITPAP